MTDHYDLIVIGSGPGGASLAQALAPTGKRILMLERCDYLPREQANWSAQAVFVYGRYQAAETWTNADGGTFSPQLHYYVGGNSKVYGSALFRLRERDFDDITHAGGISPAWPVKYNDFAPYYDAAEALFHVHGTRGEDPTEPPTGKSYPYPPVKHEPKVAGLSAKLTNIGLRPFRCWAIVIRSAARFRHGPSTTSPPRALFGGRTVTTSSVIPTDTFTNSADKIDREQVLCRSDPLSGE
ncbi:MAG: hypothetical protein ABJA75_15540 [Bradyrhizobium sp.]